MSEYETKTGRNGGEEIDDRETERREKTEERERAEVAIFPRPILFPVSEGNEICLNQERTEETEW